MAIELPRKHEYDQKMAGCRTDSSQCVVLEPKIMCFDLRRK